MNYESKVYTYNPINSKKYTSINETKLKSSLNEISDFDWNNRFNGNNNKLFKLEQHFINPLSQSTKLKSNFSNDIFGKTKEKSKYKMKDMYGRTINTEFDVDENSIINTEAENPINTGESINSNLITSNYNNKITNTSNSRFNSPVVELNTSYRNFENDRSLKSRQTSNLRETLKSQIFDKESKSKKKRIDNQISDLKSEIRALEGQNNLDEQYLKKLKRTDERYNIFFDRMTLNLERLIKYRKWLENIQKSRKKDFSVFDDNMESTVVGIRNKVNDHNYNVVRNIIQMKNEEKNAHFFTESLKQNLEAIRREFNLKRANHAAEKVLIYERYGDMQFKIKQSLEMQQANKKKVYDHSSLNDFYAKFSNAEERMKDIKYTQSLNDLNEKNIVVDTKIHNPDLYYFFRKEKDEDDAVYKYNKKSPLEFSEEELRTKITKSQAFFDRYKDIK